MREALSTRQPRGRRGSGSLFQKPKGNGRWHIQYNVPAFDAAAGKTRAVRKREYCGLPYAQAQKRLADRLGKISRGEQFDAGRPRTIAELYTALYTHTENNLPPGSRKLKGMGWKWEHLQPVFAHMRADLVNSAQIEAYKKQRREEGAALATLQRELAMLRRMFRYGKQTGTVHNVPHFGLVKENNVRKGYVEQAVYERMAVEAMKEGLWLRALLETAYTYGWRKGELIGLQVGQLDFGLKPTMRLYDSKNGEGRVVPIMSNVLPLLSALCQGKKLTDQVFTRDDGNPVKEFRAAWQNMCIRAAVPCPDGTPSRFVCKKCGALIEAGAATCQVKTKDADGYERKCGGKRKYIGLLVHDMRRSAAKRLRESGIHEKLIMDIGGWKTRSMFDRYTITDPEAMRRAMQVVIGPLDTLSIRNALSSLASDESGTVTVQ
jgi:integrase